MSSHLLELSVSHPARRFSFPSLGIGVGLRTTHYRAILEERPAVDWFEVLSENYMQTRGRPAAILDAIAERYPVVLHGSRSRSAPARRSIAPTSRS